jgi:hypothetical protein
MTIRLFGPAAVCIAVGAMLAGCSSSPSDDTSGDPAPSSTATAVADGSTATPTIGNLDDPLCAAAQQNVEDSQELESKTSDLTEMMQDPTFLTSDDATDLNQWGDDMLVLVGSAQDFYDLGVQETAGDDVNADFQTLSTFVEKYSQTLAQTASDAATPTEFFTTIQDVFSDPDITAAVQAAPNAAQNVADYLGERCDITGLG